jgi:endonuclease-3
MPESLAAKTERLTAILARLERAYPGASIELDHRSPLELLVAVILSAQCTDKRVNLVTPELFARYRSAGDYAAATAEELHPFIQSCGLYRNKARSIVAMARELVKSHGGEVPAARAALNALPGVGPKTAGVVSVHLPGGEAAFPVDTHVGRLARRMGATTATDPVKVEAALQRLVPKERWGLGHQLLIFHGRRRCLARSPDCAGCEVAGLCPKRGVKKHTSSGDPPP